MGKLIPIRDRRAVHQCVEAEVYRGGVAVRVVVGAATLVTVLTPGGARTLGECLIQFADSLDAEPKGAG